MHPGQHRLVSALHHAKGDGIHVADVDQIGRAAISRHGDVEVTPRGEDLELLDGDMLYKACGHA